MGSASVFETGAMLAGKYRIADLLGQGGMGAVYLAENVDIGRMVAIKVLRPELAQDPQSLARFKQEARAAAAIGEPGIVEVLDLGALPDGGAYIVMERLEGETLRERLTRAGTITPAEAVTLIASVLDTLAAAHDRGVIHRDLKPDNIWLTARPPPLTKILDFGISKFRGTEDMALTRTGVVMGTPLYMSPEQARGSRDVGPQADIYSVGAILFEALSGQPPFPGESYNEVLAKLLTEPSRNVASLRPDVPPDLAALIEQLLSKTAGTRPPDARTAARLLRNTLGSAAMEPLPLSHVVPGGAPGLMARTAPSLAPPVVNAPTPPPSMTRPGEPPTRDAPKVAPPTESWSAPEPAITQPGAPDVPGPRMSRPPTANAPAKKGGAGPLIGIAIALVVLAGAAFGAWRSGLFGTSSATPPATPPVGTTPSDTGIHQNPFPYGSHPGPSEAELCQQQPCTIYAATDRLLYLVDPHNPAGATVKCGFGGDIQEPVNDLAVDEKGGLWAVTATALFTVDPRTCLGRRVGPLAPGAFSFNSLTFTRAGELWACDGNGQLARIDPRTAQVTRLAELGSGLGCSGDLVGLADGTVYATARELSGPGAEGDWLVRIDPNSHAASKVHTLGVGEVWALAAWGTRLIGFDRAGRTMTIDPLSGEISLLVTVPGRTWIGAGVTPLAPEMWKAFDGPVVPR